MIHSCPICNAKLSYIPSRHASKHGLTIDEMKELYPNLRYSPTQGIKANQETKDKMSLSLKSRWESGEYNNRRTYEGENNPFFGKTHSQKSRSTMGRDMNGENNPFFGKTHSVDSRESMSSSRAEGISNGTIQVRYHNTGIHLSLKTNIEERYDSKLELFRMIQLDLDPSVISWTKIHNIKIAYNNKEISRHYIPDFKIIYDDKIVIEEVKGWEEGEKTNLKQEALLNYCKENNFTYRWIFQDDIIFKEYKQWLKII